MSPSVTPILLGEDYQHLYFWIQAARMFMEDDPAEIVYIEHPIIQAFDDVVAVNRVPLYSHDNRLIEVDHFQLKYHVDGRETIRALDLSTPSFIGATKNSLLDRAYAATKAGDIPKRLTLVTAWRFDPEDPLRKLISNNSGEIVSDRLFVGGSNVRDGHGPGGLASAARWRLRRGARASPAPHSDLGQHAALPREAGRRRLPQARRVRRRPRARSSIRTLRWSGASSRAAPRASGRLTAAAPREGEPVAGPADPIRIGSAGHRDQELLAWRGQPRGPRRDAELRPGLPRQVQGRRGRLGSRPCSTDSSLHRRARQRNHSYNLYLDTHLSIAYLAGYLLGKNDTVAPVQGDGRVVWRRTGVEVPGELWTVREEQVGDGSGMALAIEVTRPTAEDVRIYAGNSTSGIGRMLVLTIAGGTGPTSVRDSDHAWALARDLGAIVEARRTTDERAAPIHVFELGPGRARLPDWARGPCLRPFDHLRV